LFGGTLRLFLSKSSSFNTATGAGRNMVVVNMTMPKGAQLDQMNFVAQGIEKYIAQFRQVEQFQCRINSGQSAIIEIVFKKAYDKGSFPFQLKSQLESKAAYIGMADFQIYGVGQVFNNQLDLEATNMGLTLQGYNYERLYGIAEKVKQLLLKNPRVEKIAIGGVRDPSGAQNNFEYMFKIGRAEKLLINQISPNTISSALGSFTGNRAYVGAVLYNGAYTPLILSPTNKTANIWQVMNEPVRTDSGQYVRLKELAVLQKERVGTDIVRQNQQYQLVVNYNFIGDSYLGELVSDRVMKQVNADLPLGYTLKSTLNSFWDGAQAKLVSAILLTIAIVFMICVILLNDLWQALGVVALIPISYIGIFLTLYFFDYKFDEGGYASFIVLCGIVVSAALYILNDYNNLLRDKAGKSRLVLFISAYNSKIIPVLLSRASIILAMLPFMVFSDKEPFWYSLAISVSGGLVFSMIALLAFMPVFLKGLLVRPFNMIKNGKISVK
jgi:multidrug efflux pump subunit AcrB